MAPRSLCAQVEEGGGRYQTQIYNINNAVELVEIIANGSPQRRGRYMHPSTPSAWATWWLQLAHVSGDAQSMLKRIANDHNVAGRHRLRPSSKAVKYVLRRAHVAAAFQALHNELIRLTSKSPCAALTSSIN